MHAHAQGRVITPPNNSAWRCRQFVMAAMSHSNCNVDEAFAAALGIQPYDLENPDQLDLVRAAITSLRRQQQSIISSLNQHSSVTPELFSAIEAANAALAGLHNVKQLLTNFPQLCDERYTLALGWAANVLPSSESTITHLEITQVLNDVIALKTRLMGMRFPSEVHAFLEQLLKELEEGIVRASFEGVESLHRACRHAVAEISGATERLRGAEPNLNDDQRSYLTEAAEKVEQVGKIAGGFSAVIDFAGKLVPLLSGAATAVLGG